MVLQMSSTRANLTTAFGLSATLIVPLVALSAVQDTDAAYAFETKITSNGGLLDEHLRLITIGEFRLNEAKTLAKADTKTRGELANRIDKTSRRLEISTREICSRLSSWTIDGNPLSDEDVATSQETFCGPSSLAAQFNDRLKASRDSLRTPPGNAAPGLDL